MDDITQSVESICIKDLITAYPTYGKLLVSELTGYSIASLYLHYDEKLSEPVFKKFIRFSKKIESGIPLQYVLGYWYFYGRKFKSDFRGLIPRPETERLVETVLKNDLTGKNILDIGTGSGIIALTLAMEASPELIMGIDISEKAIELAKENEEIWGNQSALKAKLKWEIADLFPSENLLFDYIVSNAPYVGEKDRNTLDPKLKHEPENALFSGWDGLNLYRRLIPRAIEHLRSDGKLFIEIGWDQGKEVQELFAKAGFSDIHLEKDWNGFDRIVYGTKKKL